MFRLLRIKFFNKFIFNKWEREHFIVVAKIRTLTIITTLKAAKKVPKCREKWKERKFRIKNVSWSMFSKHNKYVKEIVSMTEY